MFHPFDEQHDQLRDTCRAWVATLDPSDDAVAAAATVGLLGLTVPADRGGQGGDLLAAVVLAEELGAQRGLAAPVLEHGEIALPALARGSVEPEAVADALRGDGRLVVVDADVPTATDGTLAGTAVVVGALPLLGAVVVADDGGALLWVAADSPGLTATPVETIGGPALLRLTFDGTPAQTIGGQDAVSELRVRRQLLLAAAAVAAGDAAIARSRDYASQRHAFGRPVISFQALRHALVDAATDVAAAHALTRAAQSDPAHGAVGAATVASLAAHRAAWRAADLDVQVHGGLGYSTESEAGAHWVPQRVSRLVPVDERRLAAAVPSGRVRIPSLLRTPPLDELRARARHFLDRQVVPHLSDWEQAREFPRSLFGTVAEAGLLGLTYRAGDRADGLLQQAVWIEELARCGSGGLAADLGAHTDLAMMYVARAGDADQHARWLQPSLDGALIGGLAITEPGTGSDVAGITTRARRTGDHWTIDGAKVFITNGSWADYLVVAAKVDPHDGGGAGAHSQVTLFVVPGDAPGLERRRLSMLGWNLSHTGELFLDGVTVEDTARLGEIGSGFGHIVANFAWERVSLALGAVVAAETGLEWLGADAPVDLRVRVAAGRALTEHALALTVRQERGHDDGPATLRTVAMSKLATQTLAVDVLDEAIAHTGIAAMAPDHPLQRWWRDARLGPIGGGTDQIMREIIGRTW